MVSVAEWRRPSYSKSIRLQTFQESSPWSAEAAMQGNGHIIEFPSGRKFWIISTTETAIFFFKGNVMWIAGCLPCIEICSTNTGSWEQAFKENVDWRSIYCPPSQVREGYLGQKWMSQQFRPRIWQNHRQITGVSAWIPYRKVEHEPYPAKTRRPMSP